MSEFKEVLKNMVWIFCAVFVIIMILLTIIIIKSSADLKKDIENLELQNYADAQTSGDKIHFLNTGNSDAILLESDGRFAMIDAGEDTDNPRGFEKLEYEGYEEKVLEYLRKNVVNENGKVHLDFVLGTHSHSDHIGGFDTIIAQDDVEIDRAYLKVYDSSKIKKNEVEQWDNQEVYDQMVNALNAKNIPIISDNDGTPFEFGNFTITLFNTDDPEPKGKVGENDQSYGILVEKNGTRVFLSGDMDNLTGDESRLADKIGKVDLLKVGHHSYVFSSTRKFIKTLSPTTCVVTNEYKMTHKPTLTRIKYLCNPKAFLMTVDENGIIADIGDNGEINYYNQIH